MFFHENIKTQKHENKKFVLVFSCFNVLVRISMAKKQKYRGVLVVFVLMVGFSMIFIGGVFTPPQFQNTKQNDELQIVYLDIACLEPDVELKQRYAVNLEIIIDEEQVVIPENLGIESTCNREVNTQDKSGKIYVEAKNKRDFQLKDFFAVWARSFNKYRIFDRVVDEEHIILMYVNDITNNDYEELVLEDGQKIKIEYLSIIEEPKNSLSEVPPEILEKLQRSMQQKVSSGTEEMPVE